MSEAAIYAVMGNRRDTDTVGEILLNTKTADFPCITREKKLS
jgi:hypothetical protein